MISVHSTSFKSNMHEETFNTIIHVIHNLAQMTEIFYTVPEVTKTNLLVSKAQF